MEILNSQTSLLGEEKSTSSREDSPANRFRWQGSEKVQPITVTSGRRCCEQLARFNHVGSWAKTFSGLLIGRTGWYSSRCTLTWKLKATRWRRIYFQLVASALPTDDTERGLLPTVQTQGLKVCEKGQSKPIPLGLIPTPTAIDAGSGRVNKSWSKNAKERPTLALMARRGLLLITPTASDGIRTGFTMDSLMRHRKANAASSNLSEQIAHMIGGGTSRLNPLFVAEMMGFPEDWTVSPFLHGAETV